MTLSGCQSVDSNVTDISPEAHGRESFKAIEFTIKDTSSTKAPTPITSLSQFNVSATTGSAGSEASKLSNVVFTSSNGVFRSDAVWPSSDPGYHFYASNVAMTHNASGQSVTVSDIDKDIVCAYLENPSYKVKNKLIFNHILARVGTVSFTNLDLCSNVRLSMKYSGSGTYNIGTGAWSGVGGQSTKELSTADNKFWIIPGTYDATLTYTDANGNPQSKTLSKEFKAGIVNNISAKLDGSVVVKTEDEYEAPTFTLGTISDVPARGGDSGTPLVTSIGQRKRVKKTLADGTVKYDPDWTAVSSPDYTVQYGKTLASLSDNCPSYHGDNLGTTAKARTKLGDVYVRVKIGNKTTDKTLEVYQQANEETLGTLAVKSFSYSPKVGAAGGTASPTVTYELPYSWTSGLNGKYTTDATLAYTTVTDNAGATLDASTGAVTWAANSGTERSETERVTVSLKGKSNTKDAASTQSGDAVDHYDEPVVTLSYSGTPIAYNSTSAISPTLTVKQNVYYVSGASETKTLSAGDYTVSYSGSVTGLSVNSSTGSVTPTNNTGSTIAAKTEYTNPSVSLSYGNIAYTGGSSSPSISYSQKKTSYTEGRNSTNARSTKVTASVTAHSKSASATADVKQNGDGGKAQTSSETTVTSGGSVSYGGSASGFSLSSGTVTAGSNVGSGGGVSYSDPTVSFSSSTTTIGYTGGSVTCNEATYSQTKTTAARNSTSSRSITVTATVTLNGKTGTKSATCTQNGDAGASKKDETITSGGSVSYSSSGTGFSNSGRTISASSNAGSVIAARDDFSEITVKSFSYDNIAYTGGTSSPSISYSQTKTSYTEGRKSTSGRSGSITASVTLNSKTGSKTINFTQNGDGGKDQTSSTSSVTSGATITYTAVSGSSALSLSSGKVTAGSNAGSGGGTEYGTPVVTFSPSSTAFPLGGGSYDLSGVSFTQTVTNKGRSKTESRSKTVKASLSLNGKTAEKQATCTQNGDSGSADTQGDPITTGGTITYSIPSGTSGFSLTSSFSTYKLKADSNNGTPTTTYSDVSVSDFSYPDVPAAGGTALPTGLTYSQTVTSSRTSTSAKSVVVTASVKSKNITGSTTVTFTQPGDVGQASSTTDVTSFTVKYSASYKSGFTLNSSATGEVKWASYTSTTSDRTNDVKVTVTGGGSKSGSKTVTSKQLKKNNDQYDIDVE